MYATAGLLLLIAFDGSGQAKSSESRPDQQRPSQQVDVAQHGQPEPAVSLSPVTSPESALRDALIALHTEQEARAKDQSPDYEPIYSPSVLVQIGLLIVGFFYTLYARRQWSAIKEQSKLFQETLVANKRAFISADSFGQYWEQDILAERFNWRFRPSWRNAGQTPTKNATMYVSCEVRNAPLPPGYRFEFPKDEVATAFVSAEGGLFGSVAPRISAFTPQEIRDAAENRKFIYLWGWMRYNDVFPNTPQHITHFCWQIVTAGDPFGFIPNTQGQPPTLGTLTFNFLQYTEGNYAD
jgi:hypothetical protein